MQRYLAEEAQAGWTLVEKFDNSRIRLKRPAAAPARRPMHLRPLPHEGRDLRSRARTDHRGQHYRRPRHAIHLYHRYHPPRQGVSGCFTHVAVWCFGRRPLGGTRDALFPPRQGHPGHSLRCYTTGKVHPEQTYGEAGFAESEVIRPQGAARSGQQGRSSEERARTTECGPRSEFLY
jgi:hypothetical protein